ncbi:hypothetical protein HNR46_002949 [Haloferula luteola]|uniref:PEP-CTERM protein-sorting domain-containing protein n=1 Tax=Haloferula luteola TaxID=595692 RepID=A0A840VJ25_9BACT|nr:PEP-CTERM sorting domain-containing protein [Haloferula luteola]MBB5352701.1 hypothetical protein [Haloferula luteola]
MKYLIALASVLGLSHGAVLLDTIDLSSSEQSTTVWTDLTSSNTGLAADSGSGSLSVVSPGFQASSGLYSFMADYGTSVTQTTSFDIQSVVFQIELSPNGEFPYSGGPLLTLTTTSGTLQLAATAFAAGATEWRTTGMGETAYSSYAWQWDLSAYGDTITSVTVDTPLAVHSSVTGARIDVGDSFQAVVVPEPSALLLSLAGAGFLFRRRR